MNWVGGARNRLKQNPERKFQRQYFNPRRINGRPLNKSLSPPKVSYKPRPPPIKQPRSRDTGLSQDLIGLHTLKNVHDLDNSAQGTQYRPATRVHMDSARKHPINSSYDIELPMSPSTVPSTLELLDVTSDDMSLYGDQPRVSTMKRTNHNTARQFDPLSGGIGMGYGSEYDVSFGMDERVLSESVISGLPAPVKRHRPSWNELNSTTESIFPTSKAPSKLFQSIQDTRFKPPSRNDGNTARTNIINRAPEYVNPSKRSKASNNSVYRNSVLDTDAVLPVTTHGNSDGKATYRDWYASKGGGGDGGCHSSRSSNIQKPDPFRCDAVSTNILDRETPFNSSTISRSNRSLDVHTLTTFHRMQKPANDTNHTHSSNSFDSFCSNTDTIVSRGSTYEERPVLLNLNRPNKIQISSGRLVSKISTALEPFETTPTLSINKPHPFSVPDNKNVSNTTGTIHALSAFEKMIQSLENEDPTPPTTLPPAQPTSLTLAPPTLPAITVESGSTKKQDIKWMEFVQGESEDQNETIHESPSNIDPFRFPSVRLINIPPPQSVHNLLDTQLPRGVVNEDYSISDNDTVLDADMMVGIAEDPEIVLSDEEVFTSADAFENFYHNHSIREKKKGKEMIDNSSERVVSYEGPVQNHKADNSSTEHCVAPLTEIASPPHHKVESDLGNIDQPVKRIKIDTPIKAPLVTTPTTDITSLHHTSYTQTDCAANISAGTQTVFDVVPSQNNVTLLDAATFTGEDQITTILNSVTTQTDIPNDMTDPIPRITDSEAHANIADPAQARLLRAFKLNSDRIFSVLSTCNEGDSIHNVQKEWMENERLFKELTNDLVYQSLLSKLDQ